MRTWDDHRRDHAAASVVLDAYYAHFDEGLLDPTETLDAVLLHLSTDHRRQSLTDLQRLLHASPTEADAHEALTPWLSQTGVPDGTGYRDFLTGTIQRVRQSVADPTSLPEPGHEGIPRPPRVSRFVDLEAGNAAATAVLRAHEQQLRAWAEDPGGWWRQHFYLPDTGATTGYVLTRLTGDERLDVRGAVVVMKRDPETGQPFVLTAYPEVDLPTESRTTFPDLAHLFGGYLGQDCYSEGGPLACQHNLQATTTDPARSRVREQLDALLGADDDTLRAQVEALGSYVLPAALRAWVVRMRWRLDAFDWTARPHDT